MTESNLEELKLWIKHKLQIDIGLKQIPSDDFVEIVFWFEELGFKKGPLLTLAAEGLHRHRLELNFDSATDALKNQIRTSSKSSRLIAAELLEIVLSRGFVEQDSTLSNLLNEEPAQSEMSLVLSKSKISNHTRYSALKDTVEDAVVPILSALAELIGYEEEPLLESILDEYEMEGEIRKTIITQRERSRRNREMCLHFHGVTCAACGFEQKDKFDIDKSIIEVHHIQPVGLLDGAKVFDPKVDLIPLCPNCHRAIHTKNPVPYSLEELKQLIKDK